MPVIRTKISQLISKELGVLIIFSTLLLLLSIWWFYRSWIDVVIAFVVVMVGIVWSLGTMYVLGYKLTLLTAIVPTLIIIIGVPNCIYFLNKYHAGLREGLDKEGAILKMVKGMGKITLFCNVTMAIGFFVFVFTNSKLLVEFGVVAGLNIVLKFGISYCLIPLLLYFLPLHQFGGRGEGGGIVWEGRIRWFYDYICKYRERFLIFGGLILVVSVVGILRVKALSFVVDDIPSEHQIVKDLRFFERHFRGILPLEVLVDTRRKQFALKRFENLEAVERLANYLGGIGCLSYPLSIVEGLKFVRQGYYFYDSGGYVMPNGMEMAFMGPYLKNAGDGGGNFGLVSKLVDGDRQVIRLSIRMADIGSERMDSLIGELNRRIPTILDTTKMGFEITGGARTFLEGNMFIMQGLRESIFWAVVLISLCMIYLFRSVKIIVISLIPNLVPLVICLGFMGFKGVYFQPSTVIIFSIVLGIATDITIRYLVVFKLFLRVGEGLEVSEVNYQTLQETFTSILFTAIALIGGFLIFGVSEFGGIRALGWLSSFTLFVATLFNLVFLPLLLNLFLKKRRRG